MNTLMQSQSELSDVFWQWFFSLKTHQNVFSSFEVNHKQNEYAYQPCITGRFLEQNGRENIMNRGVEGEKSIR